MLIFFLFFGSIKAINENYKIEDIEHLVEKSVKASTSLPNKVAHFKIYSLIKRKKIKKEQVAQVNLMFSALIELLHEEKPKNFVRSIFSKNKTSDKKLSFIQNQIIMEIKKLNPQKKSFFLNMLKEALEELTYFVTFSAFKTSIRDAIGLSTFSDEQKDDPYDYKTGNTDTIMTYTMQNFTETTTQQEDALVFPIDQKIHNNQEMGTIKSVDFYSVYAMAYALNFKFIIIPYCSNNHWKTILWPVEKEYANKWKVLNSFQDPSSISQVKISQETIGLGLQHDGWSCGIWSILFIHTFLYIKKHDLEASRKYLQKLKLTKKQLVDIKDMLRTSNNLQNDLKTLEKKQNF